MELQNLVKVSIRTLDLTAAPLEITVASVNGCVSGKHVFRKVCDLLGLAPASRSCFSLFEKSRPLRRYCLNENIPIEGSELFLGKWCFESDRERDLLHIDPVAAHLVFLQAQHDVQTGKFDFSEDEKRKLDECLEPGFQAENQYIQLCHKHLNYHTLCVPDCKLLTELITPVGSLKCNHLVTVIVMVSLSKFGVRLVADQTVAFTWFEVSRWKLSEKDSTVTLTWVPAGATESYDVPLCTPQFRFLLAGVLEMVKLLQNLDKCGASFHADMISVESDGTKVWENGLYNPTDARATRYTV